MTIETPEFQGTHLWERLHWAKEKLEPIQSDYRVVWEDPNEPDEPAKITIPDPNWLACALQGGILPPVEVYWELKKDEAQPDFKKHTRGYLLHNTKPVDKMTEEEAIEIANDTDYGLSTVICGKNNQKNLYIAKNINSGRIWINQSIAVNFPNLPIGGFKQSGLNRECGIEGLRTYSEIKTLIVKND